MGREDFITESGRVTDFEIAITDAYFATVPGYRDGTDWFLHWVGTTDIESQPIMDREGFHPSWRLGEGWESIDGGKTVQHPTKGHYNKQTPAGELIDAIADITSSDDGKPIFSPDPLANASTATCDWYVGSKWKMGAVTHKFNIDGTERVVERSIPTEYLGMADAAKAPAAAPAAAESKAAPSNKVLGTKLKALAKKSDDFTAFEEAALALDGVVEDDALLESVLDESATGFYQTARS